MKNTIVKITEDIKDICIPLYKILIPFVFIVKLLEISGVIEFLAELIQPLMSLVGLTPELGLVLVTAILVNMYAAIVLFINLIPILDVNVAQVTILTTMILVCHNIPIESAVCKAAGISFTYTAVLRFFSAFLLGFILKLIYFNFELLMEPFDTLVKLDPLPTEFWPWLYYQFVNLVYVFFIVCIMVIILEILKKIGIERLFEIIFVPPLKLFGIQKEAMNIIIVGMTIGIQYGGGILIKDVKSGKIDKQSVFLAVSLLNLLHAIIEDTILMALIGGHISGILFARIIFSLVLSYFIFMIYKRYFKAV
ncbi:nucleoside recognition domain-containing protein [Candidatus Pelagibacter sp. HIMB109]|uniref:nucleoside recognition domain-containing protein n=1 Tax=Candidatus Pelagibacter sp. HIMB109 TaxID=3415412 RepID=UPI003F839808